MTPAGWHPDPGGTVGQLRWWDGQVWTEHVHPAAPAAASPPLAASPLDATVLEVAAPRAVSPGCRVFGLSDGAGTALGNLVETSRGLNDSALGAALSRSRGFQHAVTRELRGPRGYPELVLAWGPATPGMIAISLPDRRLVGRLILGDDGWAVLGHDDRRWATASSGGVSGFDARHLSSFTPDGVGGWRAAALYDTALVEPLRSLVSAAASVADLL